MALSNYNLDRETEIKNFYEFIFLLLELHNTVSLLEVRKAEYKANPTEDTKYWYFETSKAVKLLNDKLQTESSVNAYCHLIDKLDRSRFAPQYLQLAICAVNSNINYWSAIPAKLSALRRQSQILNELANQDLTSLQIAV